MQKSNRRSGFSLIELMVVITIIGLLGGIVGVNVYNQMKQANIDTTKAQMRSIEDAINHFRLKNRRLPEDLSELVGEDAVLGDVPVPTDAWGNDFIYEPHDRRNYDLISLGADGADGGEDEDEDIDRETLRRKNDDE